MRISQKLQNALPDPPFRQVPDGYTLNWYPTTTDNGTVILNPYLFAWDDSSNEQNVAAELATDLTTVDTGVRCVKLPLAPWTYVKGDDPYAQAFPEALTVEEAKTLAQEYINLLTQYT